MLLHRALMLFCFEDKQTKHTPKQQQQKTLTELDMPFWKEKNIKFSNAASSLGQHLCGTILAMQNCFLELRPGFYCQGRQQAHEGSHIVGAITRCSRLMPSHEFLHRHRPRRAIKGLITLFLFLFTFNTTDTAEIWNNVCDQFIYTDMSVASSHLHNLFKIPKFLVSLSCMTSAIGSVHQWAREQNG